jgi:hypothetical protein
MRLVAAKVLLEPPTSVRYRRWKTSAQIGVFRILTRLGHCLRPGWLPVIKVNLASFEGAPEGLARVLRTASVAQPICAWVRITSAGRLARATETAIPSTCYCVPPFCLTR